MPPVRWLFFYVEDTMSVERSQAICLTLSVKYVIIFAIDRVPRG